jgi:hypothetical protein
MFLPIYVYEKQLEYQVALFNFKNNVFYYFVLIPICIEAFLTNVLKRSSYFVYKDT